MKRTKPPTKEKSILENPPHKELGGHMPRPPKDCPAPKTISETKRRYVDCTYCSNCRHSKTCKRWLQFKKEWEVYEKRYARIKAKYNHNHAS